MEKGLREKEKTIPLTKRGVLAIAIGSMVMGGTAVKLAHALDVEANDILNGGPTPTMSQLEKMPKEPVVVESTNNANIGQIVTSVDSNLNGPAFAATENLVARESANNPNHINPNPNYTVYLGEEKLVPVLPPQYQANS
jgi:hypothetical protein